jgi:tRNA threonylcarbamoyladenosine biosynthesis protein TsaB
MLLRDTVLGGDQRTAQALAPKMRELLADVAWSAQSVELVAVTVGPGSFTGLRIGVTMAKTFAYSVAAEIIGVDTLAILASQVPASPAPLWVAMDAQRQELFVAKFALRDDGRYQSSDETRIVPVETWLAELKPGERVTGPAMSRLVARLPAGVTPTLEEYWQPTAAAVGRLGWQRYRDGQRDDVWTLAPRYFRPSAAEEKAARRSTINPI